MLSLPTLTGFLPHFFTEYAYKYKLVLELAKFF